jgi:zinc D-Ala-D-Ala carboxypeptidase
MEEKKIEFNIKLNYFDISEFDQPGLPGSGKEKMDVNLLMILDNMRHRSDIPYKITSGYRSPEYNKKIGGVKNSPHIKGKAADISAPDSRTKYLILEAAIHFGIERIGVGSNFIHIDIQEKPEKPTKLIWTY